VVYVEWPIHRSRRMERMTEWCETPTLAEPTTNCVDGVQMRITDGSEDGHEGFTTGHEVNGYPTGTEGGGVARVRG